MTAPERFTLFSRVLHWAMAVLVVAMLLIGFAMVASIADYRFLQAIHRPVGVLVLVLAVVRIVNRLRRRPPAANLGRLERLASTGSELLLYALLVAQPLVGWAMVSASGTPVILFGSLHLPRITPADLDLYSWFREVHTLLAYALFLLFTAHMLAVLFHTLVLRDGLLSRMTFGRRRKAVAPGTPADGA
ncbi:cytochrome B [Amycolatopsis sp. WAC 01375]|uniref:cytochrome b n=1 Tax=unclassified Amycolatopsis TaxID=2618356 RepID=UPI000F7AC11C|nr:MULTISPECIES: cytochrome b/b6 domain-containing protein [unclassified Amycolatopsis]RSM69330.1 cytochrome B [Amycolatopsis sp. WAC 01375]RSN30610.1 cytochrome B [Amycolatopsis sp. WAC 01416]